MQGIINWISFLFFGLGFVIFLMLFRNPSKNLRAKRYAAGLGLITLISGLLIPVMSDAYYQRDRIIKAQTNNLYEFGFASHIEDIKETLDIEEYSFRHLKLNNMSVDFEKNGEITRFTYEMAWKQEDGLRHARVTYDPGREVFKVKPKKIDQWFQYGQGITPGRMFKVLDEVNLRELTPKEDSSYYGIFYTWLGESFNTNNKKASIIEKGEIEPLNTGKCFKCNWFVVYGMVSTGENSYSSEYKYYYLFDIEGNDKKAILKEAPESQITLDFEVYPDSYQVSIWGNNNSITQTVVDNKITVPKEKAQFIYEIGAKWEQGATFYAFTVSVK